MEKDDGKLYRNLLVLLKIFSNRPNHLAKYLTDNKAFNEDFIDKLINSKRLNNMQPGANNSIFSSSKNDNVPYFSDFDEMNNFYEDIINVDRQSLESLNFKLANYLNDEKYEEAANLRDYMKSNNIPINIVKESDGKYKSF